MRRLRYFLTVCDHGGFSRATAAVGAAQPALTRQIQLLELALGVELVICIGRNARPSQAGQTLLTEARPHLEGLDHLVACIRRDFTQAPIRVSLRICPSNVVSKPRHRNPAPRRCLNRPDRDRGLFRRSWRLWRDASAIQYRTSRKTALIFP
ncbi:MAG: LysR family transcriptional regulator [Candidatus Saccharibacteria bacterium]|nr:LysR family transcriptional regulator [Pseudorhodobacter sp.]